jgi:hypothetical protein
MFLYRNISLWQAEFPIGLFLPVVDVELGQARDFLANYQIWTCHLRMVFFGNTIDTVNTKEIRAALIFIFIGSKQ